MSADPLSESSASPMSISRQPARHVFHAVNIPFYILGLLCLVSIIARLILVLR